LTKHPSFCISKRRAKPIRWLGDSREAISGFPDAARQAAGYQLWRVQCGREPNDWKPVPGVGAGVQEIRIHTETEHRVLYIAKLPETIFVLHAFEKRGRRTPRRELDLARNRLRLLLGERALQKE